MLYTSCSMTYHLKCLGSDFENYRLCNLSSTKDKFDPVATGTSQDLHHDDFVTDLKKVSSQRGLKFIHQNIRSLRQKVDELRLLVSACSNLHDIALIETWLSPDITDNEIAIDGFKVFRKDRNGNRGGVAVYVKDTCRSEN